MKCLFCTYCLLFCCCGMSHLLICINQHKMCMVIYLCIPSRNLTWLYLSISLKNNSKAMKRWLKCKGVFCQAWQLEFHPQNPYGGRKEPVIARCLLASTYASHSDMHIHVPMCMHACVRVHTHAYKYKINR